MPSQHRWNALRTALLSVLVMACSPFVARAVTVSVVPNDTTVTVGDTFTLRLVVDAVPDLKAYQLIHRYASNLQYLGALPGEVLTQGPDPFVITPVPDVTAPADTAWTDCAKLFSSTSGPGILLYLRFKATGIGNSPITCLGADLRDSFNVSVSTGCQSGIVRVEGPVEVQRTSWGRVKASYR